MKLALSHRHLSNRITFKKFLFVFLPLYVLYYTYILVNHELWRDEIQPWGLAASSDNIIELFSKMEYEGRPPLWQIILFFVSRFSADPNMLKLIAGTLFVCNTLILLSLRKFTPSLRVLLLLGFYFTYGYSVTARDYNLLLLLHLLTIKYFEVEKQSHFKFLLLLGAMGMINGYGLILVVFWIIVACLKQRKEQVALYRYVPISLVGIFVFVIQQAYKPPNDSVFATNFHSVSFSEIMSAISNVFVFPFLPIHRGQAPGIPLIFVASFVLILVFLIVLNFKKEYTLAISITFALALANSLFGHYMYWWHLGSVYLVLLACIYGSLEKKKTGSRFKNIITIFLSLQIFGSVFGLGRDFEASKTYAHIADAGKLIKLNCSDCVVVTNSSLYGSSLASFIRPTKVFALDARQYVDFTIWKRSLLRDVKAAELESMALQFENPIILTSAQLEPLDPKGFKLIGSYFGSVWGDDFKIYTLVNRQQGGQ